MSIENFEHIPEQPEGVPGRPIAIALVWTVAGILASALVVWALMRFHADGGGRSDEARPSLVPPAAPFQGATGLEIRRLEQESRLETWSWADRERRVVRVPAEVAIERYLAGRAGGAR